MPSDEDLTVPQEITLSTPWFKAVAAYMNKACEEEIKEFMLLRAEYQDPRKTLKEGAAVTACGVKFLQGLKKSCQAETKKFANCIDHGSKELFISKCHKEQSFLDKCVEEHLGLERPELGYFSKLHVHESAVPKPVAVERDYKAEAAKILKELPPDYHLKREYKKFQEWRINPFSDSMT
uniref:NADH dehydrogenase [ubiquinone] 1 alpha subcomplex subunit 8 n=2 Tax=Acrobeloides nanus TaxID=290746 RepID=A0A914E265_9BILA